MTIAGSMRAIATDPVAGAVAAVVRRMPAGPASITVLTYHRVAPRRRDDTLMPGMISAEPADFERQLDMAERSGPVLSMADLLEIEAGGRPPRSHAVAITFDDAYRDVARYAWPILKRRGLPATLFVPTGFADEPHRSFWWDRLHHALVTTGEADLHVGGARLPLTNDDERRAAMRRLRAEVKARPHDAAMALVDRWCGELGAGDPEPAVLGWDALSALADDGMTLASHTVDHPVLTRVGPETVAAQIAGGMRELRERLGVETPVFAYPSGAHDAGVAAAARTAGIRIAFTTERGSIGLRRADWLRAKRVNVGQRTSVRVLDAQLVVLPRIGNLPMV